MIRPVNLTLPIGNANIAILDHKSENTRDSDHQPGGALS